jgi:hypothetical protein
LHASAHLATERSASRRWVVQSFLWVQHLRHGDSGSPGGFAASVAGEAVDGRITGFSRVPSMQGSGMAGCLPPGMPLAILAGAKATPHAGEDRNLQIPIVPELRPQFGKGGAHFAIEGIEPFRAVHAQAKRTCP